MGHKFAELAFTPTVRQLQIESGSRDSYARMDEGLTYNHELTEREMTFIGARDSFYMASVGETNWPYIQHRGGAAGFVKIIDKNNIAFADFSGNRQYVSTGNFKANNRVALFFMDYPNQRRLKLLGTVTRLSPTEAEAFSDSNYSAIIEGGFVIQVEAFDWNCPQHITPRFTETEIQKAITPMMVNRDLTATPVANADTTTPPETSLNIGPIELIVSGIRQLTPRIRAYEFSSPSGTALPKTNAGSHLRIPVRLGNGDLIDREYSISRATEDTYEIAVLHEDSGRGGSIAVHNNYQLGTKISTDIPLNLFPLEDSPNPVLLVAGGIGITPIRSMAQELQASGKSFSMHYAGPDRFQMAYLKELKAELAQQLNTYISNENSRLDIEMLLKSVADDTVIYACGPDRLISDIRSTAKRLGWSADRVRFEKFK